MSAKKPMTTQDDLKDIQSAKDAVRQRVWNLLEHSGASLFPGAQGRIPNFKGALRAAEKLASTSFWKLAKNLKCNPDLPQRPVRLRALREGKVVFMAVPRLREENCFIRLDPKEIPPQKFLKASAIKGAFQYGIPVHPKKIPHIDLVVAGSVAVHRNGRRIGKGGGYSDLEYALGKILGFIDHKTVVMTTVHELQLVEEELPADTHDITVDYIVTSGNVLRTSGRLPKPSGIEWKKLSSKQIEEVPILRRLRKERGIH